VPGEAGTATDFFACPKHMVFGPCGGVRASGACEVSDHPCVFLDTRGIAPIDDLPTPPPLTAAAEELSAVLTRGRAVVADLPARALDAASTRRCARIVAGSADAVLLGDAPSSRVQFSPSLRAQLVSGEGLRVWSGVNARDRNRVAIEGELASLAEAGVGAVHCVTGDHPLSGSRPDAAPVFDLDATRIAALARGFGHLVSVAASPAAPPRDRRPALLLGKLRAGAAVCFVDHCGGAAAVRSFVEAVRSLGASPAFLACVPVVLDRDSALSLAAFPGLVLPAGYLDRILSASDPAAEGIAAAAELSEAMLQIHGVRGVNLSGGPGIGGEERFAEALASIGSELGGGGMR
jgi:5,10-methylenetetrahydrofolate reductase